MLDTVRRLVPQRRRAQIRALGRRLQGLRVRGDAVACPCCGGTFARFLPYGRPPRPDALCPGCGALERHRFLWLYLERVARVDATRPRLLHVAPEPALRRHLERLLGPRYLTTDLFDETVALRCDLTRLPLRDGSVDAVVCYHVLEHVSDDRAAMRQLRRVLRPGGWAVFEVPIRRDRPDTDEDPGVTDPAERLRRFGQEDHVRHYGEDFYARLQEAGFAVEATRYDEVLPPGALQRHGVWRGSFAACRA